MMMLFSQTLAGLMNEKNVTVNELAKYASIDRSTVYKIVRGTRKPSGRKMVEQIAEKLTLSDKEKSDLIEAYYLTILGEKKYYGGKQITEMFNRIAREKSLHSPAFSVISEEPGSGTKVLNNQEDIISAIFSICALEGQKKEGQIRFFTSRYEALSLYMLHKICGSYPDTKIVHVIALDDSRKTGMNHRLYNIDCLCNILPLVVRHANYELRHFYIDIHAMSNLNMLMSEMVVTEEAVCVFDPQLKHGFLIRDEEVQKVYQDIFRSLYSMSALLASRYLPHNMFSFIQDNCQKKNKSEDSGKMPAEYIFSPGICTVQLLDERETFTRDHLKLPKADLDIFIENFHTYLSQRRKFLPSKENHLQEISTKQGIEYFVNTGCVNENRSEILEPLSFRERLHILQRWEKCYREGGFHLILIMNPCSGTARSV